ncbi:MULTISPECIES: hypothetical protein [unclassified Streptomyces]|uniref:hypothetical protein n=1 Tax=unclassified Streptomyces TaxID=2593676 RepID=UPI002E77478F|nr:MULTISPECIES: hypothetical protein [unclassified Streptomyces]MEE1758207.1 hypothetical protein [Streptomyces sp. SP18BB07]MEE1830388.1 hypothetical protein [Streptomyces sp. SP17KL33]
MIPAMPDSKAPAHRSRRRARPSGGGASAALRYGRLVAMGAIAVVLLIAGVWGSWGCAQHVMLSKGREQGTMTVSRCADETCWGPYEPVSTGSRARERVDIERSVAVETGATYTVVVKPGSSDVVRTGPAGLLHAWVPLGGALLLAAVVVAGGLRMVRSAWVLGGLGVALITAAWVAL